jgi:hypothetical protein
MKSRRTENSRRGQAPRGPSGAGPPGYTLLELLVAMSILIILGGGLVVLLKQGITTWHTAEKRGAIYDRARMVLDRVAEDLRAAAGDSRSEGAGFWVRFLCDADSEGRPRLRFTRAISGESVDPVAREGGKYIETTGGAHLDLHGDVQKILGGKLLSPGGYEEVLYALDADSEKDILWRGVRSPIGGAGSLFVDRNVEGAPPAPAKGARPPPAKTAEAGGPGPGVALAEGLPEARSSGKSAPARPGARPAAAGPPADEPPLARAARPYADRVMHISYSFWTPVTNTWDRDAPPRIQPKQGEKSGPIATWDSTRAILDERLPAGQFGWRKVDGSLDDPSDDAFPERVEVTLVLEGNVDAPPTALAEDLAPADRSIPLSSTIGFPEEGPDRFVKIEGEWIRYEKIEKGRLVLPPAKMGGRGERGTSPSRHMRGAAVELGTTFRRVVEMPAVRMSPAVPEGRGRKK